MKKYIILTALVFALCVNLYAQEQEQEKKAALGIGAEWNMNSRENYAGGVVLAFDYALPHSLALGLNVTASSNFSGITVIEPAALFRWYLLGGYNGFFLQADCGAYMVLEDDEEFTAMFLGGLRGGFRIPFESNLYIEPYGRIGYPFAFGIGVLVGFKF
jgi:hypothetical protein